MHGNRVKINIFKCNKFNILSYIFYFSSFFNGSAFSLYCVVITSLSLGREIRIPGSTPLLPLSFFHFTKTYSEHLHHSSEATVLSAGAAAVTNICTPLPSGAYSLLSEEFICLSKYKRELKLEFQSWKVSLRAFHSSPFKKNNSHLLLTVIYGPDIVLNSLHALSTGVGCHFPLQGIFPTQESNLGLPHCKQILYHLSHQGSPLIPHHNPKR